MVLCKFPVPERPTNLDESRARVYCACSWCGWGCLDFFSRLSFLVSFSLSLSLSLSFWETARYRLKCCLKGPLSQDNQPKLEKSLCQPSSTWEPLSNQVSMRQRSVKDGIHHHLLCPRYSGPLTSTARTPVRVWDIFSFYLF